MSDDLIKFLRARLAEDEEAARAAKAGPWHGDGGSVYATHPTDEVVDYTESADHIARHDPVRVLAEVDAKQRIVDAYLPPGVSPHPGVPCTDDPDHDPDGEIYGESPYPGGCVRHIAASQRRLHHDYVLRLLALPYADHPDYREEWTP